MNFIAAAWMQGEPPAMDKTENMIESCVDLRLPPRFEMTDFETVADCLVAGFDKLGTPAAK